MARSSGASNADGSTREIRLVENPDVQWMARDLDAEVSAQGRTRTAALDALDDVVAALRDEAGHEPTDEELRDLGVDPATARTQNDELSDALQ